MIGVVSDRANTYRLSLDAGRAVPTNSALTFADGMAVRIPDEEALEIMRRGMERLIEVTDDEIAEAIRVLYTDTHTLAEGAGAAAFAALMQERARMQRQARRRDRLGAEHRPAVDADRAGGRHAAGRVRLSAAIDGARAIVSINSRLKEIRIIITY